MFLVCQTDDGTPILVNTDHVSCITPHPEKEGRCRVFEAGAEDGTYWTVIGSLDEVYAQIVGVDVDDDG